MVARDIILANINHGHAPRPGLTFDQGRINDMLCCELCSPKNYKQKRWLEGNFEYYDDEWGNIWRRIAGGPVKGEVFKPAIEDWRKLDDLAIPNYADPECSAEMRESFAKAKDKFKLAVLGGWIFDNARYIRKMDAYFLDMAMCPQELKRLHKLVARVYETKIHAAGQAGADGIFFCEDMGTQNGLLFSPVMWREFFRHEYTRLFGIAHDYGMKVFMHSCGQNWEILPDLLAAGVDCFQFNQPELYDMPCLAGLLRTHKAALWSPVDIQRVLPSGDRRRIEEAARKMVNIFAGGLIFRGYHDLAGIGVKPEWDMWAYKAILSQCGLNRSCELL